MSFPVIVSPALAMVPKFVLAAALLAEVINVSMSVETVRFGMARVECRLRCRQNAGTEMSRRDEGK